MNDADYEVNTVEFIGMSRLSVVCHILDQVKEAQPGYKYELSKDSAFINLLQGRGESHLLTVSSTMNNSSLVKCAMSVTMNVFIGFQVLLNRLVAVLSLTSGSVKLLRQVNVLGFF